jgi:hypothetical protein
MTQHFHCIYYIHQSCMMLYPVSFYAISHGWLVATFCSSVFAKFVCSLSTALNHCTLCMYLHVSAANATMCVCVIAALRYQDMQAQMIKASQGGVNGEEDSSDDDSDEDSDAEEEAPKLVAVQANTNNSKQQQQQQQKQKKQPQQQQQQQKQAPQHAAAAASKKQAESAKAVAQVKVRALSLYNRSM